MPSSNSIQVKESDVMAALLSPQTGDVSKLLVESQCSFVHTLLGVIFIMKHGESNQVCH